jgi:hypothetical protein
MTLACTFWPSKSLLGRSYEVGDFLHGQVFVVCECLHVFYPVCDYSYIFHSSRTILHTCEYSNGIITIDWFSDFALQTPQVSIRLISSVHPES